MIQHQHFTLLSFIYLCGVYYGYHTKVAPYITLTLNNAKQKRRQVQTVIHDATTDINALENMSDDDTKKHMISTNNEIDITSQADSIAGTPSNMDQGLEAMRIYRQERSKHFYSWYKGNSTDVLIKNADDKGPILDFVIAGFPKTGTTTLMANLGRLAPMDIQDICTPVHQTVYYSYMNWAKKYGEDKILRGSKCPAYLRIGASKSNWLVAYSKYLPKTKLIIGIRHPMKWFKSFWDMQLSNNGKVTRDGDPYQLTDSCANGEGCRNSCPKRQLFCVQRARFHLAIAQLGKTELSSEEREWLAPNDPDGGVHLGNDNVKNPIFLYEQRELNEDYVWEELAAFLEVENITHNQYRGSHGGGSKKTDFCEDKYDDFRAKMMPIAYEVAMWMQIYFIPLARNSSRPDVVIAKPDRMAELVEDYKIDPCGKLQRQEDGTYS